MKKQTILIIIAIMITSVTMIGAQVLSSCDRWGNYCDGTYCVYNNLWGDSAGAQCITASSTTSWNVRSNQTGTGVKTYPNSSREPLGVTIGSLRSLSSTMNVTQPAAGDFCTAWDIWAPTEIMIWMNKYGNVSPWGSFVETATIGGVIWDVYKNGYPGFVRQSNTNSMTVDIKAILDYCVSKGWLSSTGILEKVQGGFEITSTGGVERTFTMNSYSVSISSTEPLEEPAQPPPASESPVTDVWYRILAGHSGKAMEVADSSTADSANVQQWSYTGALNQQWRIEVAEGSYVKIINRNSGKCLQVQDWSTADGGNVTQGTYADYQNNQQWTLEKEGIYYKIINRNSGKLVDVQATSTINGGNIHQWTYYTENANSQRWSFLEVGSSGTPAPTVAPTTPPANISPAPTNAPGGLRGDVNGDGSISITDALSIAQYYVGSNPAGFIAANADTNCDGSIGIVDALRVAQYYVGLITAFCP